MSNLYSDHHTVTINTETGKIEQRGGSPTETATPHAGSTAPAFDPGVDTAAEARAWSEKLSRLERTANDANLSAHTRQRAATELALMHRATPLQIESWRRIDAARRGAS